MEAKNNPADRVNFQELNNTEKPTWVKPEIGFLPVTNVQGGYFPRAYEDYYSTTILRS